MKIFKNFFSVSLVGVMLLAGTGMVSAQITDHVVQTNDGGCYQYSLQQLKTSYLANLMGDANEAQYFNHYMTSKTAVIAYVDDVNGYIDFGAAYETYASTLITGNSFDLDAYSEGDAVVPYEMPAEYSEVALDEEGQVVVQEAQVTAAIDSRVANPLVIGCDTVYIALKNTDAPEKYTVTYGGVVLPIVKAGEKAGQFIIVEVPSTVTNEEILADTVVKEVPKAAIVSRTANPIVIGSDTVYISLEYTAAPENYTLIYDGVELPIVEAGDHVGEFIIVEVLSTETDEEILSDIVVTENPEE